MAYLGEDIKKLGFGLMRLPRNGDVIDIEQTKEMVDLFMGAGFTYFDTAWAYDGSEEAAREALVERYPRDSFTLATKNAAWKNTPTKELARKQLDESLERTGAGYFDFYLLHNVSGDHKRIFDEYEMWDFVNEKKTEGVIKNIGFSFHSTPEDLETLLTAHPEVDFVQLQINYADWEDKHVQSRANYEMARKYGKPVVIMEPVKGGMLSNPAESVKNILEEAEPDMSCASWAIRFAASLPGVITVLSGMSTVSQVEDNISYMKDFKGMTEEEEEVIKKAQDAFAAIPLIPCTGCNYCAGECPRNIGISGTFAAMNNYTLYGRNAAMERLHGIKRAGKQTADMCVRCGRCEKVCPQHIAIRDELAKAAALLL